MLRSISKQFLQTYFDLSKYCLQGLILRSVPLPDAVDPALVMALLGLPMCSCLMHICLFTPLDPGIMADWVVSLPG